MNDHELRQRLLKLRVPPPDPDAATRALDESLSALKCDGEYDEVLPHTSTRTSTAESPWTWREWLWPSPLAWGALAVIWLAINLSEQAVQPAKTPRSPLADSAVPGRQIQTQDLLLAQHEYQLLLREHLKPAKIR